MASTMETSSLSGRVDVDNPPFSRVFVVCSKRHTAEEMRDAFMQYGEIDDVWMVKDKITKEAKGICYIKFAKASQAALAIENMDGKTIGDDSKPIKAMIAQSKSSGSKCDFTDDTALTRLFVICPKEFTEEDLRAKFESFGEIEYVQIVKDHATKENKGFGYVKFYKASTAAIALENCDKGLKAVMAEPKSSKFQRKSTGSASMNNSSTGGGSNNNLSSSLSSQQQASAPSIPVNPFLDPFVFQQAIAEYAAHGFSPSAAAAAMGLQNMQMMQPPSAMQSPQGMDTFPGTPTVSTRLFVIVSPSVSQDQLSKLFDLIPGMELCDLKRRHSSGDSKGFAYVTFNSIGSAVYAKEKLNGFEYPPGHKLVVKYAEDPPNNRSGGTGSASSNPCHQPSFQIDGSPVYTTAALPAPQPLADPNTEPAARLFIVCHPSPPPEHTLKDVFSRFGNLIDVWIMRDRNFGYAKFASKESADAAIAGLHGQEVLGMRLKVLHADPPKSRDEASRKRPRT